MKIKTEVDLKDLEHEWGSSIEGYIKECVLDNLRLEVKKSVRDDKGFKKKIESYREKIQKYSLDELERMFGGK